MRELTPVRRADRVAPARSRSTARRWGAACLVVGVLGIACSIWAQSRGATGEADRCGEEQRVHLVVVASAHRLLLCEHRRAVRTYSVRLASGGLGKSREGDDKLPLGWYSLGSPRRSSQFGMFIPVGYPTPEQMARGFTGGGVGVHGPHRSVRWLGWLVNLLDTTDGCVGLATDDEMREVSGWVRRTHAARIRIE